MRCLSAGLAEITTARFTPPRQLFFVYWQYEWVWSKMMSKRQIGVLDDDQNTQSLK